MQISIADAKPPYVEFEVRAIEDRNESIAKGHYVAKDVIYALITPAGSKDRIERVATEWLAHIDAESHKGRFDPRWVQYYQDGFNRFKAGQEVPLSGTPLSQWPGLSPSQHRMLTDINIRTIEDLASATEEAIGYIGMGARALVQRAKAYLESTQSNQLAEENTALKLRVESLEAKNKELEENLCSLQASTGAAPKRPTKPEKDDE